jgi:hypothetical protein
LLTALVGGGVFLYVRFWMGPGPEELERLRRDHATLRARVERGLRRGGSVADAPESTVLVGVPARVAERVGAEVVTGFLREVTLSLHDLKVRKEDEVRATILGRRTLGRFTLALAIAEDRARLRPGKPRLSFARDLVKVALPVTIAEGSGRGRLRFQWDGRGMAGAVCGDLDTTLQVAGTVVPGTHTLEGAFHLSTEGATIVARPEFGEIKVRVPIEPSNETWNAVDALVGQRGAVCRTALKAADLQEKLRSALARGVAVTIPRNALAREMRFPAAIERPLDLPQRSMHLDVRPSGVVVSPARLWYGAIVEVRKLTEDEEGGGPSS